MYYIYHFKILGTLIRTVVTQQQQQQQQQPQLYTSPFEHLSTFKRDTADNKEQTHTVRLSKKWLHVPNF